MDLRYRLARLAGVITFKLLRLKKSGGTSLPGLIALKIDKDFVTKAAKGQKSIVVTGTNGKTTTSNQLADILRANGWTCVHNASGSNLLRGVASTFIEKKKADWAVFETDEAAFAEIVPQVKPEIILILNLFRDQMDRYGEIDKTARMWHRVLENLANETKVILNADDPTLGWLGKNLKNVLFFGISDETVGSEKLSHTADAVLSPASGERLTYSRVFFSHIGIYEDRLAGFKRPDLNYMIRDINMDSFRGSKIVLETRGEKLEIQTKMPGIYNIYNIAGATVVGLELGISQITIAQAIERFKAAFGRFEEVLLPDDRKLVLFLIKNPVGFDQVISLINMSKEEKQYLIGINDRIADGKDISWLWDVNIEALANEAVSIATCGTRANEMAMRLKYAGWEKDVMIDNDPSIALDKILQGHQKVTYCLLTYTTMLEFRKILVQKGLVKPFYQK